MYDILIAGAGAAGSTVARQMAEKGKKVLVLEKRPHIGGNCYDVEDEHGVLIHLYGPHIFHTDREAVWKYLSRFTKWTNFRHEVVAKIDGGLVPVPFNLNTLHQVFPETAAAVEKKLLNQFSEGEKVSILALMQQEDEDLRKVGEYVYKNIYLYYTMKQWGKKPEEIDPSVTARVPVKIAYDNGYFTNKYQAVPENGFTAMFEKMLAHPGITVKTDAKLEDYIEIRDGEIWFEGEPFAGEVIFTGALDEFFGCKYGRLPYRTLDIAFEHYDMESFQGAPVVNYTVSEEFTRITEYKYLTRQTCAGTTISKEYPRDYTGSAGEIPYYVIENADNRALYEKYHEEAMKIKGFHVLGRLAEYKYYDIDTITEKALQFCGKF